MPSPAAEARLFCFPYSGCGATMYKSWPDRVARMEICPIQLPGRENRTGEPPYETYESVAAQLIEGILPFFDVPFALFGHCAGALAAFETTLQLAERGLPTPIRLFVSSQVAPHEGPYGRFLRLSEDELSRELAQLLRRVSGGMEPEPELLDLYRSVLVADVEANKRYRKSGPVHLPGGVTAIGWRQDAEVQPALMTGWNAYGAVTHSLLDGDHYAFLDAPSSLLEVLEKDTASALSTISSEGVSGPDG
jgi:surfactin synthase thioesterase subunit